MDRLDGASLLAEAGVAHFQGAATLGALSEAAIRCLFEHGRILALADGETLIRTGDTADAFFIVLEGQLAAYCKTADEDVPILTLDFGEQIGYASMIALFPRPGEAQAHGATVVLEVDTALFYQLHEQLPFDFGVLMLNLSREMARGFLKVTAGLVCASAHHPVL
ncbi:Crp/Fnr family transcriptional regulator [Nitrogeniibacter aestuarii]|uniref:Crp/Fnr family transcriptional regulator n=1 Tax=Nitrogeniibacter aestuarii TaxID=2815343 RepID=UPI001D0F7CD0|nr:cyclic nucleotide-binding domain-containing protein [Nitrogeniibacter aestuarii]